MGLWRQTTPDIHHAIGQIAARRGLTIRRIHNRATGLWIVAEVADRDRKHEQVVFGEREIVREIARERIVERKRGTVSGHVPAKQSR